MRMPKLPALIAVAVGFTGIVAPSGAFAEDAGNAAEPVELSKGQQKLASILEGLEAGEPINCIRLRPADHTRVIDDTALVYRRGNRVYVNYTRNPDQLEDRDVMITRRFAAEICKSDIITKVDSIQGIFTGNVILTEFIPYTRP